jgi:hypothetical protein
MPIPEPQLETWSKPGAVETAERTHKSIRAALEAYNWPSGVQYEVYLQGSYRNRTNIRGDSDVDIVVQLNSTFLSNLSVSWKRHFGFRQASYGWKEFKSDVLKALRNHYQDNSKVSEGKKALKVRTSYLRADVVVSLQYRKYPDRPRSEDDFVEGMTFWVPSENRWVINYPKLHYKNGAKKNKDTNGWYKPTIRMFKNARTYLVDKGVIPADLAPSYFLECLLHNVPNDKFGPNLQSTFREVIIWLRKADFSRFFCQNRQLLLFGSSPEQWSEDRAYRFLEAMVRLWNDWR